MRKNGQKEITLAYKCSRTHFYWYASSKSSAYRLNDWKCCIDFLIDPPENYHSKYSDEILQIPNENYRKKELEGAQSWRSEHCCSRINLKHLCIIKFVFLWNSVQKTDFFSSRLHFWFFLLLSLFHLMMAVLKWLATEMILMEPNEIDRRYESWKREREQRVNGKKTIVKVFLTNS